MNDRYSVQDLLAIERSLDRTFAVAVTAVLAELCWPLALRAMEQSNASWGETVQIVLTVAMFGAYVWFALAVRRAATAVGSPGGLFLIWVLAAPVFAVLKMGLVSAVIIASPLSLKFLLSGQLRSKIHDRTFEDE